MPISAGLEHKVWFNDIEELPTQRPGNIVYGINDNRGNCCTHIPYSPTSVPKSV